MRGAALVLEALSLRPFLSSWGPAVTGTGWRCISYSGLREEDLLLPKVAIIGRPNVGKSALFNKLLRRAAALVYDTPESHVTRDFKEGVGKLGDLRFRLVDTSGLEPEKPQRSIQGRAVEITARVLKGSDLTLLVVDAKTGLLASDEELAQWLRRVVPPAKVLVVANKAENQRARQGMSLTVHDCYRLGFGEPVAVSAATGEGLVDLYVALQPVIDECTLQNRVRAGLAAPVPAEGVSDDSAQRLGRWEEQGEASARLAAAGDAEAGSAPGPSAAQTRLAGLDGPGPDGLASHAARMRGEATLEGPATSSAGWQLSERVTAGGHDGAGDARAAGFSGHEAQGMQEAVGLSGAAMGEGGEEEEEEEEDWEQEEAEEGEDDEGAGALGGDTEAQLPVRMAILGQPNVGKSTLLNSLLQEQRALTGPEPGLTRDAVHASLTHQGVHMELVDTAGWIGVTRGAGYDDVGGALADMARRESARALASAHVAVLVLDAERAVRMQRVMTQRELSLAGLALSEGRALVVAANKLDALPPAHRATYLSTLRGTLEERFLEAGQLPVVGMSAVTGQGVEALLPVVQQAFTTWNKRVSTGRLNRFVQQLHADMSGSSPGGAAAALQRVKYMTQVKARPPSFAAFLSGSQPVQESFVRFLAGGLREALGFQGVPVRIWFRYKEARSAKHRAINRGRGRPLALRALKTRARDARAARRVSEGKHRPTFRARAKSLLEDLASPPSSARLRNGGNGGGATEAAGSGGAGGGDGQRRASGHAGPSRAAGFALSPGTSRQAAPTNAAPPPRAAAVKASRGAVTRAELLARLQGTHKPSAPLHALKVPAKKKRTRAIIVSQ